MKKLISTLAILACAVIGVNAQRVADLKVTLKTPAAGTTLNSGADFPITYTIKNNGPAKYDKTKDTMITGWFVDGNYIANTQSMFKLVNDLNVGDSITLPDTLRLTFTDAANGTHEFCVAVLPYNTSADSLVDHNGEDNFGCQDFNFFSTTVGLNEIVANKGGKNKTQSISFYPNPVSNVATTEIYLAERQKVTVTISDITGKVVLTEEKGFVNSGSQKISANLNALNNGMYLVKVVAGAQQYMGKVVVAK